MRFLTVPSPRNIYCTQVNIQPLLRENLVPLLPPDYRPIPLQLFFLKPHESVTSTTCRCQSNPICDGSFTCFQPPAPSQGFNRCHHPFRPQNSGLSEQLMIIRRCVNVSCGVWSGGGHSVTTFSHPLCIILGTQKLSRLGSVFLSSFHPNKLKEFLFPDSEYFD